MELWIFSFDMNKINKNVQNGDYYEAYFNMSQATKKDSYYEDDFKIGYIAKCA